jgi:hypothetical protein
LPKCQQRVTCIRDFEDLKTLTASYRTLTVSSCLLLSLCNTMHTYYVDIPQPFTRDACYILKRSFYGIPTCSISSKTEGSESGANCVRGNQTVHNCRELKRMEQYTTQEDGAATRQLY